MVELISISDIKKLTKLYFRILIQALFQLAKGWGPRWEIENLALRHFLSILDSVRDLVLQICCFAQVSFSLKPLPLIQTSSESFFRSLHI